MNIKKFLVGAAAGAVMFGLTSVTIFASTGLGTNWCIYNVMQATAKFWDINQPQYDSNEGYTFPIQAFDTETTGSFAVYFLNNYNIDMTDKIITATVNWTSGSYETRSTVFGGAYARVEFQDTTAGAYTSNDYWWYSGDVVDLSSEGPDTLLAPLTDRAHWTNICGQVATDTVAYPGPNCVGGTDPAVSPSDGFTNAMKNVKQVGLSFGSAGSYASGVAIVAQEAGTFTVSSFDISN